ncbi:hypothetical protein BKK81_22940 [Cupriavidus sp. USMAHM13]|uniref:YybH family protein n=1 Tax=Cupriavidus sp. USMAHM13 TaxID=1389192 RepID=UPI0008A6D15F|nr:hypothetical protein [Cupriavidus sp. USMAHM13]AOZ02162.1 hypothetical protein BKK81_22940 [Cupriavidus sp. USMAHM13]
MSAPFQVMTPAAMNETFARAFNSRRLENLLALYEPDAILKTDGATPAFEGAGQIAGALGQLLVVPGTMRSLNNFCLQHGELALLRADYAIHDDSGALVLAGSSAEIVRRQPDGSWRYVVDHATGASLPRVA